MSKQRIIKVGPATFNFKNVWIGLSSFERLHPLDTIDQDYPCVSDICWNNQLSNSVKE